MIDGPDVLDVPKSLVVAVLRFLWWLGWDVCVQTVGWSIGWSVLRLLTLGRYPAQRFRGLDDASAGTVVAVDIVGLVVLALGIWWLAGTWP